MKKILLCLMMFFTVFLCGIFEPTFATETKYIVTTSVSTLGGGTGATITGGGEYAPGDTVTITANINSGYTFDGWSYRGTFSGGTQSANGTIRTYEFIMANKNVDIFAQVGKNSYVNVVNMANGNVSGSGTYSVGETVTISATPSGGYAFSGWTVKKGGVTLADSSSPTTTFIMGSQYVRVCPSYVKQNELAVINWNTTGDRSKSIVLKTNASATIEWGDSSTTSVASSSSTQTFTHSYTSDGDFTAKITGNNLTYLEVPNEKISSIDFGSTNTIEELYCQGNSGLALDISNLKSLKKLDLSGTGISLLNSTTHFDVSRYNSLTDLWYDKTSVSKLKLGEVNSRKLSINKSLEIPTTNYTVTTKAYTYGGGTGATITGGGEYAPGDTVTITANINSGYTYDYCATSGGIASGLKQTTSGTTRTYTFTMPSNDASITVYVGKNNYVNVVNTINGNVSGSGTYSVGETVTISATPNEGYAFNGWTVKKGGVTLADSSSATTTFTMGSQYVRVSPSYVLGKVITVTVGENGAITPGTTSVENGGSKTFTITPNEGYKISLVLVDNTAQTITNETQMTYTFSNVNQNHTISATFSPKNYTVSYNANGGTNAPASQTKTHGVDLTLTSDIPTNTGYTFAGWTTNQDGTGDNYAAGAVYTVNASVILYAKWVAGSGTAYTVYHYFENVGDTNYTLYKTENKTGTTEATITLANEKIAIDGGTYKQGSLTGGGAAVTTTTIVADGTTKIYLYYSRNTYTLTLNKNSYVDSVSGAGTYKYGASVSVDAILGSAEGYTYSFTNWISSNTSLVPNQATKSATITMPAGDVTLTANASRTPITYTISYELDGGAVSGTNPTSYTVESNAITLVNPTKDGYNFTGWTGSNGTTPSTTVTIPKGSTGNKTYTANWEVAIIEPNADTSGANAPVLATGLTPVNWNGTNWESTTVANWKYNYNSVATATQSNVEGNGDSAWANAQTADGSLYVWIPRYSYKITSGEHQSGNSWNSLDNPGTNKIEVKFSNGTTDDTSNSYIKHPAFTFGSQELQGIWVAKYEASQGNTTSQVSAPTSSTSVAKSIPGVASWRNRPVSNMFDYAYNTYRNADSHLMKNVEWGAVAYLTNAIGRIPYINNSSSYITGNAGGSQDASSSSGTTNAWNTAGGVKASTTHNVYGIYDMSGGANEYVAAYVNNGHSNLSTYASSLVNAATKYKDVYPIGSSDSKANNYAAWSSIKGDAVYETSSSSSGTTSWDGDSSYAPGSGDPVFVRGGIYSRGSVAGVFYFYYYTGYGGSGLGFRVVLTGVQPVTEPNAPVLATGLTPVNWNGSAWETTTVANWDYNYNSVAEATHSTVAGNGDGKWANAQTADGSLYVWIPRYSYKITSGEHSDGNSWNSLDNPGTNKIEVKFSNGTTDDTSNSYIKHPAFTFGTDELKGIWVAKYEASQGNTTSELSAPTSSNSVAKSIPGVASWRVKSVSYMFDYAYNTYRNADSHLMKNVEWGAVAYLTNAIGRIPYINNSEDYITGNAGGSQDAAEVSGTTNAWNTANGVKASTTHNVYGIYDMSGGAWEYVSAYYTGGDSEYLSGDTANKMYAGRLYEAANTSSLAKYVDTYEGTYDSSKKGDAVYETSSSSSSTTSWDGDALSAPYSIFPVFSRGGYYGHSSAAGVFEFGGYNGCDVYGHRFRVVLGIR